MTIEKAGKTSLPVLNNILKVSVSALKTYESCPRKYYYSYILRPDKPEKDWAHLTLGNFVHEVLEYFHNELLVDADKDRKKLMTYACKLTELERKNGEPKHKLTEDVRKDIKRILLAYLAFLEETGLPNVQANEKKFSVHIDEDLLIRGVIDRVDIGVDGHPERYHLVDYKSGKSSYLDEFQLLVYGIPLLEENPNLEEYKGTYLALKEDMKQISYTFTKTDVERVKDKIRSIARQIREDTTWEPRPQFLCKYCDYEFMCDAAPKKRAGFNKPAVAHGGEIEWQ